MPKASWIVLMLMLMGCSQKASPRLTAPELQPSANAGARNQIWAAQAEKQEAAPISFAGQTAPEWAEQLKSEDHAVLGQASHALAEMGEGGYRQLADGMATGSNQVRLVCIQVITKPTLLAHADEMVPLLRAMLKDREPMIRRSAAARICWFGTAGRVALPELQIMAQSDPVPDIRQVALASIEIIQNPKAPPQRETVGATGN